MSRFEKLRENKGLTLIEFITVIAILGIITAIVLPYYLNYKSPNRYDYFGGVIQFQDGSNDKWPADVIVGKDKGDPTILYLVDRHAGFVRIFELNKPEIMSIERFKEIINRK